MLHYRSGVLQSGCELGQDLLWRVLRQTEEYLIGLIKVRQGYKRRAEARLL